MATDRIALVTGSEVGLLHQGRELNYELALAQHGVLATG